MSRYATQGAAILAALKIAAGAEECFGCRAKARMHSAAILTARPEHMVRPGRLLVYSMCADCDEDRKRDAAAYLAAIERRFVALGELKP